MAPMANAAGNEIRRMRFRNFQISENGLAPSDVITGKSQLLDGQFSKET
jgi:hypothetical protein